MAAAVGTAAVLASAPFLATPVRRTTPEPLVRGRAALNVKQKRASPTAAGVDTAAASETAPTVATATRRTTLERRATRAVKALSDVASALMAT